MWMGLAVIGAILAYHTRLGHTEIYFAYGDPNALVTAPKVILKAIFYAGSDKGT